MKLVAKTEKGYLLEADRDEIARLMGAAYWFVLRERGSVPLETKIGMEVPINEIWDRVGELRKTAADLSTFGATLRGFADMLDPVVTKVARDVGEALDPPEKAS